MSHDKIRAAARKRMAETGEPYAAARRAVVSDHHGGARIPSPATGCVLRMPGEVHDWLAGLRDRNPRAARRVAQTLAALLEAGGDLGDPLVVPTADAWPLALAEALSRACTQRLERLTAARRATAAAAALVQEIEDRVRELESAKAGQQAAELRRLLPTVTAARDRLVTITRQLQARVDAFRFRKEVLKAAYAAAQGTIRVHEAIAAAGLADDDGQPADAGETTNPAQAALADATAKAERELGQAGWPEGLMELRPGAPAHSDIRILFALEPPATAVLIAVLEGPEVVESRFPEAVMAAADMLRLVRAGQAPEATAYGYDNPGAIMDALNPGTAGNGE